MNRSATGPDTRALGLEIGLDLIRLATGREHLHYGLWQSGQPVTLANLLAAQEAYTDRLLTLLPAGASLSILDIGGGAGETANRLLAMGHTVDVVVPSRTLIDRCRANLGTRARLYPCTFEDFDADRTYDVCLFSESFQYVRLDVGLGKARSLLNPGGTILIADCFRKAVPSTSRPVGGGFPLDRFHAEVRQTGLAIRESHDVTTAVAPSIDLERQIYRFLHTALTRTRDAFAPTRPRLLGFIRTLIKTTLGTDRLAKLNNRLLGRDRTGEDFIRHNTYLFLTLVPDDGSPSSG